MTKLIEVPKLKFTRPKLRWVNDENSGTVHCEGLPDMVLPDVDVPRLRLAFGSSVCTLCLHRLAVLRGFDPECLSVNGWWKLYDSLPLE